MALTEKQKAAGLRYYRTHREQRLQYRRDYHKKHRDSQNKKALERGLIRKYGITSDQKKTMIWEQKGLCAICGTDDPGTGGWHLDHNHKTGKNRGITCGRCNFLLGKALDDPNILFSAIQYLAKHDGISFAGSPSPYLIKFLTPEIRAELQKNIAKVETIKKQGELFG